VNGVIDALRRHLGEPPAGAGELKSAYLNPSLAIQNLGWRPQLTLDAGIALCAGEAQVSG
jgi:hypothetical protein